MIFASPWMPLPCSRASRGPCGPRLAMPGDGPPHVIRFPWPGHRTCIHAQPIRPARPAPGPALACGSLAVPRRWASPAQEYNPRTAARLPCPTPMGPTARCAAHWPRAAFPAHAPWRASRRVRVGGPPLTHKPRSPPDRARVTRAGYRRRHPSGGPCPGNALGLARAPAYARSPQPTCRPGRVTTA